jgi:hypothetical protein
MPYCCGTRALLFKIFLLDIDNKVCCPSLISCCYLHCYVPENVVGVHGVGEWLDGKKINFFLVKINGDVQSYFDACAICYQKRVGYRVESEEIVCRACDLRYSIYDLKIGKGSCHPIELMGHIEKGVYIISIDALKAGLIYF